jgi:hypothetical protein
MGYGWLAIVGLLLGCGAKKDVDGVAAPNQVVYRMSPVLIDGALTALAVEVHFRAGAGGSTRLRPGAAGELTRS